MRYGVFNQSIIPSLKVKGWDFTFEFHSHTGTTYHASHKKSILILWLSKRLEDYFFTDDTKGLWMNRYWLIAFTNKRFSIYNCIEDYQLYR